MSLPTLPETERWTAERVRRELMREDRHWPRYEFIDGELLVTSAPTIDHQRLVVAMYEALRTYVPEHRLGELLLSPSDIELEPNTITQPDLFVVPASLGRVSHWREASSLLLAIEVLSPSTARYDRMIKRRFFARMGVPEYWIVDPDTCLIERSLPDGRTEIADEQLVWQPAPSAEPLVIDVPAFFAGVLGEERVREILKPPGA